MKIMKLIKPNASQYEQAKIDMLNEVLKDIEISKDEEKSLIWLCGWEKSTVENICSVMNKLKEL